MKYGVRDVFDLKVYGAEGLLFEINTVKGVSFDRNLERRENALIVDDALVDVKVLNDILKGNYDNTYLRIIGETKFRGLDCIDKDVTLNITVSKIVEYDLYMGYDEVGFSRLVFSFPTKDAYGFQNAVVKVNK